MWVDVYDLNDEPLWNLIKYHAKLDVIKEGFSPFWYSKVLFQHTKKTFSLREISVFHSNELFSLHFHVQNFFIFSLTFSFFALIAKWFMCRKKSSQSSLKKENLWRRMMRCLWSARAELWARVSISQCNLRECFYHRTAGTFNHVLNWKANKHKLMRCEL